VFCIHHKYFSRWSYFPTCFYLERRRRASEAGMQHQFSTWRTNESIILTSGPTPALPSSIQPRPKRASPAHITRCSPLEVTTTRQLKNPPRCTQAAPPLMRMKLRGTLLGEKASPHTLPQHQIRPCNQAPRSVVSTKTSFSTLQ
jgi:hypothetical protein